jgi:hypothetical protein
MKSGKFNKKKVKHNLKNFVVEHLVAKNTSPRKDVTILNGIKILYL